MRGTARFSLDLTGGTGATGYTLNVDIVLLGALGVALAIPASAKTLVVTHPEAEFDEKHQAGARIQELLASREFLQRLVLTAGAERAHYSFDPDAAGVAFRRVVSPEGRLEEDLRDDEYVVGGGPLEGALQETVADLLHRSGARRVRFELGAVYAKAPAAPFSRPARNMREFHMLSPREAEALFARAAERVYGALRRRGLGDRALELRVKGRVLGVVDHDTYSPSTPGDAMPRLRPAPGRPAHAVLEFD